jgi:hypothetical protein
MLAAQDGLCAGCGKPDPEHVDHDHATGAVRGMLCFNCNQALGNVRDSAHVLDQLRDYLTAAGPAPAFPYVESRLRGMVIEISPDWVHATASP